MSHEMVSITTADKLEAEIDELLTKFNSKNSFPHDLIRSLPTRESDLEFIIALAVYAEAVVAKLLNGWIEQPAVRDWILDNTRHGQRLDLIKKLRKSESQFSDVWVEALRALSILRNKYAHNVDALQCDLPTVTRQLDPSIINKIAAACEPIGSDTQPLSTLVPNIRCALLTAVLPALITIHAETRDTSGV